MLAVETIGLTHRFGTETVLHDVGLALPQGSIYGFLGPNGAGKTTTLRLLLGLLRRQHGTVTVLGHTLDSNRIEILRRVGSSIETPSLYSHLTATENLEVWRRIFGCSRSRIEIVLRLVDLHGARRKRVEQFSLGMKQRLSIAIALLHEPPLLVLDEPTNGLDPHGILDMRRLLATLNREHATTILVSSHILSEIERLVTHVGVIHRGRLRFQGTLEALRDREDGASRTTVIASDANAAVAAAARIGLNGKTDEETAVFPALSREDAARLTARLAAEGIALYEIVTTRGNLERIFLNLIDGGE